MVRSRRSSCSCTAVAGGWVIVARLETRDWLEGFFERLCSAGFVVAAVSYRFSGEARFPAQIDDVVDAIRWLHEHAGELGVASERTYVWGTSAGGTLAALAALVPHAPPVAGAVIWYAVSDFLGLDLGAVDTYEAKLFGGAIGDHVDLAHAASPVAHVRPEAPPFLIQHGEADTWVPFDQALRMEKAIRSVGGAVELEAVPGADHFFGGASDDVEAIFERAVAFLQRVDSELV